MYTAIEAKVCDGVVVPLESGRIPKAGRALIVIMPEMDDKLKWRDCRKETGWLKLSEDPVKWQRRIRNEWTSRL